MKFGFLCYVAQLYITFEIYSEDIISTAMMHSQ